MAPKDYVARDRVPPKKTTKTKPAPKKRASSPRSKSGGSAAPAAVQHASSDQATPWFRIVFTLAVVMGFGVFLWNIKDASEGNKATVQKQETAVKKEDELPEAPKEEWEFMTTLTDPDYEVEVDLPEETHTSTQEYILQCGSFRKQEQAESMRARIAFQGIESNIKESNGQNGRWYRVVMGPYERKRMAEKDRHTLQRAGFTTCRIW
ncbi:SPOR domain-containing protein [Planctobacterium marinum]|uniref:Cell division protein FtsN n=1 Tax=Planctobacterium marinum TaxID=1631968 RepID=A0AA48KRA6_9ALTE|nr:cell division protein FtsN [Planctobacterium marinum]